MTDMEASRDVVRSLCHLDVVWDCRGAKINLQDLRKGSFGRKLLVRTQQELMRLGLGHSRIEK